MTKNEKLTIWYAALGFPPICATCPNMAAYEKQNEGATVIDCRAIGGGGRYRIEKNVYPEVWCEEREKWKI